MKEITQKAQEILDTLQKVATDTLERKRRLGEYAVVWEDNKPVAIGDDVPVHFKPVEVADAPLTDERMRILEVRIPYLAEAAVKQAYLQALAAGYSVLIAEEGALVEVFPDGTKKVLKQLEPPITVIQGQRIKLV